MSSLDDFNRKKRFAVCVDSDGCAMDTMNIKHIRCFGPCMVEEWGLEAWRRPILDRWNEINLYSGTRGINRFKGLAMALTEINRQYTPIDGIERLSAWAEEAPELSNDAVGKMVPKHTIFEKALHYMGFTPGQKLLGTKVDYVFLGACTNGRIEDFRAFASIVKGRQKAADVIAWLVPGSWAVDKQIREEGLDKILEAAGFEIRQPGCSACLAMNDDKIPAGKLSVSTSNRNFEGRQGPGARTILASPLTAAACAVTGVITDPRELI